MGKAQIEVSCRSKARRTTKKNNGHCNKENKTKMLNSKFFGALMYFLKNGFHSHMLSFLSKDKFEVIFVHQKSPIWTANHISLFKDMDIHMKGVRYLGQKNYNESTRVRFKSNMRKMVGAGYLRQLKIDKSNEMRSITKIHYQILKDPEFSEVGNVKKYESLNADISNGQMYEENIEENASDVSHFLCLSETRHPINEVIEDFIDNKAIIMEGHDISEESNISEYNSASEGYLATVENSVFQADNFNQKWIIQNAIVINENSNSVRDSRDCTSNDGNFHEEKEGINEESGIHDGQNNPTWYIVYEENADNKLNISQDATIQNVDMDSVICINNYISREGNTWEGGNIQTSNGARKVGVHDGQNNSIWNILEGNGMEDSAKQIDIHEGNEMEDSAKQIDIWDGQNNSIWNTLEGNEMEDSAKQIDICDGQNNSRRNTVCGANPTCEENRTNIIKVVQNAKLSAFSVVPGLSNVNSLFQDGVVCRGLIAENEFSLNNDIALPAVSSSLDTKSALQNKEISYGEMIPDAEVSFNNDAWKSITGHMCRLREKDAMKNSSNPFLPNVCSDDNYSVFDLTR